MCAELQVLARPELDADFVRLAVPGGLEKLCCYKLFNSLGLVITDSFERMWRRLAEVGERATLPQVCQSATLAYLSAWVWIGEL